MQKASTTVIAVAGSEPEAAVAALDRARNVRALAVDPDAEPLDRAVEAWRQALATHAPYAVHDADPLAEVVRAWVEHFDQRVPIGALEVAVHETLVRWRARSLELPDYYLVIDPDRLSPTARHWWLGVLRDRAPHRVVPVRPDAGAVAAAVAHLRAGPWWPELDRLLEGIERVAPDQVVLRTDAEGTAVVR